MTSPLHTLPLSARGVDAQNYVRSVGHIDTLSFFASCVDAYGCVDRTQRHATEVS